MSDYFEAAIVSAECANLINSLEGLAKSGPLIPISLELHTIGDHLFTIFGWREGANRPYASEEIERLAIELSRVFVKTVAVHYDDQVGWRSALLCRDGEVAGAFGEGDEIWVPYGEDGELLTNGPRYAGNSVPKDLECDCIWNGIDAALKAAGLHEQVTADQLVEIAATEEEPIWRRLGTGAA